MAATSSTVTTSARMRPAPPPSPTARGCGSPAPITRSACTPRRGPQRHQRQQWRRRRSPGSRHGQRHRGQLHRHRRHRNDCPGQRRRGVSIDGGLDGQHHRRYRPGDGNIISGNTPRRGHHAEYYGTGPGQPDRRRLQRHCALGERQASAWPHLQRRRHGNTTAALPGDGTSRRRARAPASEHRRRRRLTARPETSVQEPHRHRRAGHGNTWESVTTVFVPWRQQPHRRHRQRRRPDRRHNVFRGNRLRYWHYRHRGRQRRRRATTLARTPRGTALETATAGLDLGYRT